MGINDILQKNSPVLKKYDKENQSDFNKLVDRNTELVDELNEYKNRIDRAIKYTKESEIFSRKTLLAILRGKYETDREIIL